MVQFSWLCIPLLIFPVYLTTFAKAIGENEFEPKNTQNLPKSTKYVLGVSDNDEHKSVDFDQINVEHTPRSLEEVKSSDLNIANTKELKEQARADPGKVNHNLQSRTSAEQGNLKTLVEFERYVISKKYPYAELDNMQSKHLSMASNTAQEENQHRSRPHFFGEQSISGLSDDAIQNVEIVSRGLTGFEIPSYNQESKNASPVKTGKLEEKDSLYRELIDEGIVDQLKRLINEYEEKKRRNRMPFCEIKKPVN